VAMDSRSEHLIASEDANTYLADQWLSYIRITAGAGVTAGGPSQLSELDKIFDEFAAASESRAGTEQLLK
jgi:hypothetical protein